jgi:hypothetical protein
LVFMVMFPLVFICRLAWRCGKYTRAGSLPIPTNNDDYCPAQDLGDLSRSPWPCLSAPHPPAPAASHEPANGDPVAAGSAFSKQTSRCNHLIRRDYLAVAYLVDDVLQWGSRSNIEVVGGIVGSPRDLGTVTRVGRLIGSPRVERGFAVENVSVTDPKSTVLQPWCALPDDQITRSWQIADTRWYGDATGFAVSNRSERQRTRCKHQRSKCHRGCCDQSCTDPLQFHLPDGPYRATLDAI